METHFIYFFNIIEKFKCKILKQTWLHFMYLLCVGGGGLSARVVCECCRSEVGSPIPTRVNLMDGTCSKHLCLLRHLDGTWSHTARLRLAEH